MEFYAQRCKDGTEVPLIFDDQDLIAKARRHLQACDYKAAAVYTRSAFEKEIQKHCVGRKQITYHRRLKDYTTEDFWKVIKDDLPQLSATTTRRNMRSKPNSPTPFRRSKISKPA